MALVMKRNIFIIIAALTAMIVSSCQDKVVPDTDNGPKTYTLKVDASMDTETKTSISVEGTGYKVGWDVGDWITLFEEAPSIEWFNYGCQSSNLTAGDIQNGKATFTFELEEQEAAAFTYIAAHGMGLHPNFGDWGDASDERYQNWAKMFEYTGEYVEPHFMLGMNFSDMQRPTADSFDPFSDLMISNTLETTSQLTGNASFSFARIGTIVKITLKGLDAYKGKNISSASIEFGSSYEAYSGIVYDPMFGKFAFDKEGEMTRPFDHIELQPEDVVVKNDGTADLWLRVPAGEISDNFRIDLEIETGVDEYVNIARSVNLISAGKSITFEEGGMTTFSVSKFAIPDVEPVALITGTVNSNRDGFTAIWNAVNHAAGYDCYMVSNQGETVTPLTANDNGNGTWSITVANGLTPDTYYLSVQPIPAADHELIYREPKRATIYLGVPAERWVVYDEFEGGETIETTSGIGTLKCSNLLKQYDYSWQVLKASDEWYFYNEDSLQELHSLELWSKDDSHNQIEVYAGTSAGAETVKLTGEVVEISDIKAGWGSNSYEHVHKRVRYTFPTDQKYGYFKVKGTNTGIVLTGQHAFLYIMKDDFSSAE